MTWPWRRRYLAAGTLVAAVATGGSLYLSLGIGLIPCRLCWYQRILMYPLVVILGVAVLEDRRGVYRTVLPLSIGGLAIAAYHSWLQLQPHDASDVCAIGAGCGAVQYRVLGLTIPNLSLLAFVLVTLATVAVLVEFDPTTLGSDARTAEETPDQ